MTHETKVDGEAVPASADSGKNAESVPAAVVPPRTYAPPLQLEAHDMSSYVALQKGAAYFDLSPRHVSSFHGPAAASALNGLITNDVTTLAVGRGLYAVALTPKGKLLADVVVLRTEPETFIVETSVVAGAEWLAMVRKYVNPRLAKYKDESAATCVIGVYGPKAIAILARMAGATGGGAMLADAFSDALQAWPAWANATWSVPGTTARLVRAPYLGDTPGFLLFVDNAGVEIVHAQLNKLGAESGTPTVWDIAALEAARPIFGLDMDAATIPQEANLDSWDAISFEKGCYTGQETVARLHFRGHVNKYLRLLNSDALLEPGSTVVDGNGKTVGDIRRSGLSPKQGAIAIAMVRREIPAGATVLVANDGVTQPATVAADLGVPQSIVP